MADVYRVDVLGVAISAIDIEEAVQTILGWVADDQHKYVCVTGVHGVMECQKNAKLLDIHNRSGLTTPDGMPMVWAGRLAGARTMRRVYGPDLMLAVCEAAQLNGISMFFFGTTETTLHELVTRLQARFPGLAVAGVCAPPFRETTVDEDEAIVDVINASGADIVWVGLSTPKQELWMADHLDRLHAKALIGVGAAFDIHAGHLAQAPSWMRRSGLEWLFRLSREPRRLWRRYLTNNPAFLRAIVRSPPRLIRGPPDYRVPPQT